MKRKRPAAAVPAVNEAPTVWARWTPVEGGQAVRSLRELLEQLDVLDAIALEQRDIDPHSDRGYRLLGQYSMTAGTISETIGKLREAANAERDQAGRQPAFSAGDADEHAG